MSRTITSSSRTFDLHRLSDHSGGRVDDLLDLYLAVDVADFKSDQVILQPRELGRHRVRTSVDNRHSPADDIAQDRKRSS
jgi:hypothetical protein